MKKIFTLMLALACAMFVGVSCTPDNGGDDSQYAVKITVDQPATFPAEGGEAELNYSLSKEYAGEMVALNTEATASWLAVALADDGSYKVLLSCLPNNAAGTTPRETSFTLSYKDAEDVTVTVKQNPVTPSFEVAWSNQTPLGASATISNINADKPNMLWGAFTFGASMLEQNDGPMPLNATTKTPEEFAAEQLAQMVGPMGAPGLYTLFAYQHGYGYWLSEMMQTPQLDCSLLSMWGGVEKKMYLAVVGFDKNNANLETGEDDSQQATPIHIFEVGALAQPEVVVSATENVVEATAGTLTLDVTVNNPYGENSTVEAGGYSVPEWLTVAYADGKVTATYAANPYAKSRTAEFDVVYTYNCLVTMYGETMEMPVTAVANVKVEQKANPDVTPVTFTINVKETHFDRIVVDITPSDLNAYYVVGAETKDQVDGYYANYGGWSKICEYALGEEAHQGALTNHVISINTKYANGPDQWTYYVYAFQTDANSTVVAGEANYVETPITNDAPAIACPEGFTEGSSSEFILDVYGKGGEYNVQLNVVNAPADGYALKLYDSSTWSRTDAIVVQTTTLNHASTVFGNEQRVSIENGCLKFTVNDYPTDWDKTFDPYAEFTLYLTDAENTTAHKNYSVRVRLHPAE